MDLNKFYIFFASYNEKLMKLEIIFRTHSRIMNENQGKCRKVGIKNKIWREQINYYFNDLNFLTG